EPGDRAPKFPIRDTAVLADHGDDVGPLVDGSAQHVNERLVARQLGGNLDLWPNMRKLAHDGSTGSRINECKIRKERQHGDERGDRRRPVTEPRADPTLLPIE